MSRIWPESHGHGESAGIGLRITEAAVVPGSIVAEAGTYKSPPIW
jgi:hypothetical protein